MSIELGTKVRDRVTGYEGIAIGRAVYLTAAPQVGVSAPVLADGKLPDVVWFEEGRLYIVGSGVNEANETGSTS